MVYFVCQTCQATLKKNQVNKHCEDICNSAWVFSCIDCGKDFEGFEFNSHNSCKTEVEKYHGKPRQWKGWRNEIKHFLKAAGSTGLAYKDLSNKVTQLYRELHKSRAQDNPEDIFSVKVAFKRFTRKQNRVYYWKFN